MELLNVVLCAVMGRGLGETQRAILDILEGARDMPAYAIACKVYSVGEPTRAQVNSVLYSLRALVKRKRVKKTMYSTWRLKPRGNVKRGRLDDLGQMKLPGIDGGPRDQLAPATPQLTLPW